MQKISKKYKLIIVAVLLFVVAGLLVINKESYADANNLGVSCPNNIRVYMEDKDAFYVKSKNNMIALPIQIFHSFNHYNDSIFTKQRNRVFILNSSIFHRGIYTEDGNTTRNVDMVGKYTASDNDSILMGYLIQDTFFSNEVDEDNYYKQVLLLWAMDRLAGFSDDINYIYDDSGDFVEADVDTKYDDKYDIDKYDYGDGNYRANYYWKYANELSAGDKQLLKKLSVGDKMLKYLDAFEQYVSWYLDGENVELNSITQSDISYHVTNDYIETNLITPESTGNVYFNNFTSYEVKVSSPFVVMNKNGEEQSKFKAGESFKVRISISDVKNLSLDYSIHVVGHFNFNTMVLYDRDLTPERYELPSSDRQRLYTFLSSVAIYKNCYFMKTIEADLSFQFSQKIGNLNIKVIDSSTGDNLSKAEVTVYDFKGNEVYKYETTDKELNITLPVGEYIVKQTVTPPNYEAQTIQMRVDVTDDGIANAVLENAPLVNVPDTNMNSYLFIIVGGLIAVAGGIIFGITFRKRRA